MKFIELLSITKVQAHELGDFVVKMWSSNDSTSVFVHVKLLIKILLAILQCNVMLISVLNRCCGRADLVRISTC